jgi:hypothetical protein
VITPSCASLLRKPKMSAAGNLLVDVRATGYHGDLLIAAALTLLGLERAGLIADEGRPVGWS